jgi:phenylacetate-CoA ligase
MAGGPADESDPLQVGLQRVLAGDSFLAHKLRQAGLHAPVELRALPFTTRQELVADQAAHPPYGTNLTAPPDAFVRVGSTPGVAGPALHWQYTTACVERHARLWRTAFEVNDVGAGDRVMLDRQAWPCWAALRDLGALAIPAAANRSARARDVLEQGATVVVSTPSDALRLAEAAAARRIDLVDSGVRLVFVTGEPGGHVPSTRRRIEEWFGARCVDVYALTELGAVGWDCPAQDEALHLNEDEFVVEVDAGELVLTDLRQWAMPLVRYRTGDLVQFVGGRCACGRSSVRAVGGIAGRVGDRVRVRGVEMLPSTVENVVRRHPAVTEYQLEAYQVRGEYELSIDVEPDEAVASEGDRARVAAEVAEDVRRSLGLRLQCEAVPPQSLSRAASRPRRVVFRSSV